MKFSNEVTKKLFTIIFLICLFFVIGISNIYAQETKPAEIKIPGLYAPKLLPDHPLYFVKTVWEKVRLGFTFDSMAKAKYQINLIEKRIAEASALIKKGKNELAEKNIQRYKTQVDKIMVHIQKAREKGKDIEDLVVQLSKNTLRHQEVMAKVYEKVPEPAKKAIEKAIEVSKRGYEQAVQAIKSPVKREELIEKARGIGQIIKEKAKELPAILEQKIEQGLEKLEEKIKEEEEMDHE